MPRNIFDPDSAVSKRKSDVQTQRRRRRKPRIPPRQLGVPGYRRKRVNGHVYGVVAIGGKEHYLGEYGTAESIEQYNALVGRWLAGGRKLPDETPGPALSVNEVLLRYYEHAEQKYAARRSFASILNRIKNAIRSVRELYGMTDAAKFGPKALGIVRQSWINSGRSRKTINEYTAVIKACWRWAAAEELVPGESWHALNALTGLRRGDADVPEPRKVKPVPDAFVDAIRPYVSRQVWAMIELQRLTGMRSGEVTIMRTRDIDVTGKLWVYRPAFHKTEHHDHDRAIYLGPAAQAILKPWLRPNLDEYLFQPREAEAERREAMHAARKTPMSCGNRRGTNRKRRPKRSPGERFSPGAYRVAIHTACDKADSAARAAAGQPACGSCDGRGRDGKKPCGGCRGSGHIGERQIPSWHPHRLRHSFATRVRREYGIEAARVMLGHQHIGITEVYAERDRAVALEVAGKIG